MKAKVIPSRLSKRSVAGAVACKLYIDYIALAIVSPWGVLLNHFGEAEAEAEADIDAIKTTCNKQDFPSYIAYLPFDCP